MANKKGLIGLLAGLGLAVFGGYHLLKKDNDECDECELEFDDVDDVEFDESDED